MPKQLNQQYNVDLNFKANVKEAEGNIRKLQQSLASIANMRAPAGLQLNTDMQKAVSSAKELQYHMANAFNTKTGNLDLSKLNSSLKASGQSLSSLTNGLLKAGLQGEEAFMNLQRSITTSNIQLTQTRGLVNELWVTLKNTAKWQLSSSVLHGFMGAIQSAYGYAQDLNESLNNIRIVTGQNTDQMAKFAEQANKAAKSLSTTTTAYTDAALIYYQQGLDDKAVQDRTNITIKMANVSRQSAEEVSDQMTAVWNNFYNGSKSLEYYADVMTALGAATASSSSEIAEGLNKFAAVGETVGLSYDYAASALATVTATTRQSADVVGNAFKTLFARIQDLDLGKTLEDGTTLGQYSQALDAVGINIKNANGEIKAMDTILDEMGAKWGSLAQDQQVALAQSVAGVRQYTQLIALMDNWDFFQKNLGVAQSSQGILSEQAEIYAESWEAAQKRVKASQEALFDQLLDDKFFINLNNSFADFTEGLTDVISGMGGLKNIFLLTSAIALNKFGPSIANGINSGIEKASELKERLTQTFSGESTPVKNFINNIRTSNQSLTQTRSLIDNVANEGLKDATQQTEIFNEKLIQGASHMTKMQQESIQTAAAQNGLSEAFRGYLADMSQVNNLQTIITRNASKLTSAEREQLSVMQQQVVQAAEKKERARESLEIAQQEKNNLTSTVDTNLYDFDSQYYKETKRTSTLYDINPEVAEKYNGIWGKIIENISGAKIELQEFVDEQGNLTYNLESNRVSGIGSGNMAMQEVYSNLLETQNRISDVMTAENVTLDEKKKKIREIIFEVSKEDEYMGQILAKYSPAVNFSKSEVELQTQLGRQMSLTKKEAQQVADTFGVSSDRLKEIERLNKAIHEEQLRLNNASNQHKTALDNVTASLDQMLSKVNSIGGAFQTIFSSASSIAMGLSSVGNAVRTLSDENASFTEKLTSGTMAATMGLQGLMAATKLFSSIMASKNAAQQVSNTLTEISKVKNDEMAASNIKNILITKMGIGEKKAENMAIKMVVASKGQETIATDKQTISNIKLAASESTVLAPLSAIILAIGIFTLVIWGTVKAVQAFNNDIEKNTQAAENAETAAKQLSERYNECKQEYEDMISSMEEYQTARDGLDSLTRGTEEYSNALKEANQQALNLIQTYPELFSSSDYRWENGQLVINDAAMRRAEQAKQAEVDANYQASVMANAQAQQARNIANISQLSDTIRDARGIGNTDLQWAAGLGVAASILTAGAGTLGAVANYGTRQAQANEYNEAIDEVIKKAAKDQSLLTKPENIAKALGLDANSDLVQALYENKDELQSLANELNSAEEGFKLASESVVQSIMADSGFDRTKAGQQALNAGSNVLQNAYKEAYDSYIKDLQDGGFLDTDLNKATFNKYVQNSNLKNLKGVKFKNIDSEGKITYEFFNEETGKTEEQELLAEQVATTLATIDSQSELKDSLDKLREAIQGLDKVSKDAGVDKFIASGNLDQYTQSELNALEGVKSTKELGITDDIANIIGYNSADEMFEAMKEALDDLDRTKLLEATQVVGEDIGKSLTISAANAIANNSNNIGTVYNEVIQKALEAIDWDNLNNEQQEQLLDKLSQLDTQNWDFDKELEQLVKTFGGELDTSGLDSLITKFRIATKAENSFIASAQEFEEALSIAEKITVGEVISDDDIKKLQSYIDDVEILFTTLANGQKILVSNPLDIINEVNSKGLQKNLELITGLKQEINDLNNDLQAIPQTKNPAYEEVEQRLNNEKQSFELVNDLKDDLNKAYLEGNLNTQDEIFEKFQDKMLNDYNQKIQDITEVGLDYNIKTGKYDFMSSDYYNIDTGEYETKTLEDISKERQAKIKEELEKIDEFIQDDEIIEQLNQERIEKGKVLREAYNRQALSYKGRGAREEALLREEFDEEAFDVAAAQNINQQRVAGLDLKELQDYSKGLQDALGLTEDEANEMARSTLRLNQGIETLVSNWDNWNKVLQNSNKNSPQYIKILNELKTSVADILDVTDDMVSADFVTSADNLALIQKAAEGDKTAIQELALSFSTSIFEGLNLSDELVSQFDQIKNLINSNSLEINPGEIFNLDDMSNLGNRTMEEFLRGLSNAVDPEELDAILSPLGFAPQFEVQSIDTTSTYPQVVSKVKVESEDDGTYTITSTPEQVNPIPIKSEQTAIGVNYEAGTKEATVTGKKLTGFKYTGGKDRYNLANTNTSSSSPKKAKQVKKSSVVERYKEITDQLDDVKDSMDKASKAADRLYGKDRLKEMQKVNESLEKENDLLEKKRQEAIDYLAIDKGELISAGAAAGLNFTFDESGNITNYTDEMTRIYNELSGAISSANADGNVSDSEQEIIDKVQERVDKVTEAVKQYDETRELIEDINNEIQDVYNQWQDNNLEQINYALETSLDITDAKLETVEYYLDKISDDFYNMAEAAALMQNQMQISNEVVALQKQKIQDLYDAFDKGQISQDGYIEGLKDARSALYDELSTLNSLDKEMREYYGSTLEAAQAELAKYTDKIDNLNSVLDHYKSILGLLGREADYGVIGEILRGQAELAEDQLRISRENYEFLRAEVEDRQVKLQRATALGNAEETKLFQQQWEDAYAAMSEAQDKMLSDTETWLEAMRSLVENQLSQLAQELEKSLTGDFGSFDFLNEQLDRAKSLQEEYLTDTNKIYETTKLMRTAQQAIDETSNKAAKQRLQSFIDETQHLQEQGKLSEYELKIQQAKYDLLVAQIALEEAQNAKTQVRLQRDNEGNFGYIYTADANKVNDAQQKFEDAQNNLYNIGLEGANDYTEKLIQIRQEAADKLTEIDNNQLLSEEERQKQREAAIDYYTQLMKDYSDQYKIALTTDSRVVADAWSTDLAKMATDVEGWSNSVDTYVTSAEGVLNEWQKVVDSVDEMTSTDFNNMAINVNKITSASDSLKKKVNDEVIPAMKNEVKGVKEVTDAYNAQKIAISDVEKDLDGILTKINDAAGKTNLKVFVDYMKDIATSFEKIASNSDGVGKGIQTLNNSYSPSPSSPSRKYQYEIGYKQGLEDGDLLLDQWLESEGMLYSINAQAINGHIFAEYNVPSDTIIQGWYKNKKNANGTRLKAFNTGGYTGSWGKDGRLAMLHEKELVLNKDDTANFLASMDLLHKIVSIVDTQAASAQLGGLLSVPSYNDNPDNVLEQNVKIEATFPNATNHNEIEEAFNNLINTASQYANRKKI